MTIYHQPQLLSLCHTNYSKTYQLHSVYLTLFLCVLLDVRENSCHPVRFGSNHRLFRKSFEGNYYYHFLVFFFFKWKEMTARNKKSLVHLFILNRVACCCLKWLIDWLVATATWQSVEREWKDLVSTLSLLLFSSFNADWKWLSLLFLLLDAKMPTTWAS